MLINSIGSIFYSNNFQIFFFMSLCRTLCLNSPSHLLVHDLYFSNLKLYLLYSFWLSSTLYNRDRVVWIVITNLTFLTSVCTEIGLLRKQSLGGRDFSRSCKQLSSLAGPVNGKTISQGDVRSSSHLFRKKPQHLPGQVPSVDA